VENGDDENDDAQVKNKDQKYDQQKKNQVVSEDFNDTKKGIDKAIIGLVIKSNPTDTTYTFTDENGKFTISTIPSTPFSVIAMNMGYKPVARYIPSTQGQKTVDLGTIQLSNAGKLMDEIVVTGAPIVVKEDTVEYRADAFKVKEGAVVEDLLKKLPGIEVAKDGSVKAQGKNITKVKVNGKEFFGGDVQTATKELPANLVDKIQVIDDYGDQATVSGIKDGEAEKVLNIQLKKDKNKGFFGRTTVGAGTDDRYQASFNGNYFNNNKQISLFANSNNTNSSLFNFGSFGGNRGMSSMMRAGQSMMADMGGASGMMNAMNSGDRSFVSSNQNNNSGITQSNSVGLNFRDQWGKRINFYGSYSFSNRDNDALTYSSQQNIFPDTSFINNNNDVSNTLGNNHRLFLNFEYQIDSFNYIKISPNASFATNDGGSNSVFDYYRLVKSDTTKTSDGKNFNLSQASTPNISGTILYNHKFRKRGRNFSANLSLGTSQNDNEQTTRNITNSYIPVGVNDVYQFINQQNNNHNYGIRLTYSEPLTKTKNLDFSYSHNLNYSRNNRENYYINPITNTKTFIPFLSNDFENNFYNNRVGVSLRSVFKKYNYTLGLSGQPVSLQGNSITKDSAYKTINRFNIFPIARFAYNFSRSKTLNASYNGNATQPTFTQLQPVEDRSNPLNITQGNPALKPSMNHNINISYNNFNFISGKVLFTNLTFSTIKNQIVNNTVRLGNSGAQKTMPVNVNGFYNVMGFYTFSKPYKNRKYVITLNGTANYNHNINLIENEKIVGSNWVISQGTNFEYNIKDWFTLGTGISYSLNDVKYQQPKSSSSALTNTSSNAWVLSSNMIVNMPKNWVFNYDFDYTINNGLAASISQNLAIMNASIEKQLFKKKNGIIKLAAYDLFNQNTNVNRSINANSIVDTRSNRLARYFMLTFTYRLQKFVGQQAQNNRMGMGGVRRQEISIQ
nr:TonB-dependent receptor family protein [Ferruginibacter sp.]